MQPVAGHIRVAAAAESLHQHLFFCADEPCERLLLAFLLHLQQFLNAAGGHVFRHLVRHFRRARTRPGRIDEGERAVIADLAHKRQCVLKLLLAGEADDNIRRQADSRNCLAQLAHAVKVLRAVVVAVHPAEDFIVTVLHRQVELRQDVLGMRHHINQLIGQVLRMAGHEADARDANIIQRFEQLGERDGRLEPLAVAVHILPQQHDFLHAAVTQRFRFRHNRAHFARTLPPAHIRHDAVGAVVVAAVHNRDIRRVMAQALHGQTLGNRVLLLHLHHRVVAFQRFEHQFRQAVQVRRAKRQIHKAVLLQNLLRHAGLLNHAAAHANHQARILLAYFLEPRHVAQGAALGVVAHAAGVKQHKIRRFAVGGFLHAHVAQHSGEDFAVVRVHLAAIGHNVVALRGIRHQANLLNILPLLFQLFF